MHAALSVIIFTVSSGAGFGLLALTLLISALDIGGGMTVNSAQSALYLGLFLTVLGLVASSGHLANPRNAWRAILRFRSSWLSREAIAAVLVFPLVIIYLIGLDPDAQRQSTFVRLVGLTGSAMALFTIFCTGMIYACLRTIRQWNTALVPLNYLLMGIASGAVLLTMVLAWRSDFTWHTAAISVGFLVFAGVGKALYFFWIGQPATTTLQTATGFSQASVRLLDVGHSSGTFLTKEFGHEVSAERLMVLRTVVYVVAFALPAAVILTNAINTPLLLLACGLCLAGLGVERWLFFAEAKHVVRLYHGQSI